VLCARSIKPLKARGPSKAASAGRRHITLTHSLRQFWKLAALDTIVVLRSHVPTAAHVAARKAASNDPTHNQRSPVGKPDSLQVTLKTPNVATASRPPLAQRCDRLVPPWVAAHKTPDAAMDARYFIVTIAPLNAPYSHH
jgi:hypothetical protein